MEEQWRADRAIILVRNVELQDPGLLWPWKAPFHRDDGVIVEGEAKSVTDAEIYSDWKAGGAKGVYDPPSPCPSWVDTEQYAEDEQYAETEPDAEDEQDAEYAAGERERTPASPPDICEESEACLLNPEDQDDCVVHGNQPGKLPAMVPADRAEQYHAIRRSGILHPVYIFGITRGNADVDYDHLIENMEDIREARGIVQEVARHPLYKPICEKLMRRIRLQENRFGMTRRLARLVSPSGELPFDLQDWYVAERHREERAAQGRSS